MISPVLDIIFQIVIGAGMIGMLMAFLLGIGFVVYNIWKELFG